VENEDDAIPNAHDRNTTGAASGVVGRIDVGRTFRATAA